MTKDDQTEKARNKNESAATKADKGTTPEKDKGSDSAIVDLKPVRPKIGESKDTLRKRSEYFQKRRS